MARRVRDAILDTRDARARLKARGKPYWRLIEKGLHVGYRRLKGKPGTWWLRHYIGNERYRVAPLGSADDFSDADGVAVLDFWGAQTKARDQLHAKSKQVAAPITVRQAMESYLEYLDGQGKPTRTAAAHFRVHIAPPLGDRVVESLTTEDLEKWLAAMAKAPTRVRAPKVGTAKPGRRATTRDEHRARRASANRALTSLKAALNRAWLHDKVTSNLAWRRVKPFAGVDAARKRYFQVDEAQRLVNAAEPSFRLLLQGALQTGARFGELARMQARDFNSGARTVGVLESKAHKARQIELTEEGVEFFKHACAGRAGNALIFTKADGSPWKEGDQKRPMAEACMAGHIKPTAGFHATRHTWASLSVMNGVPLLVVAKNLGHRDTRMCERHYGHLAPSFVKDAIRAGAPRFGFKLDKKVSPIHGGL